MDKKILILTLLFNGVLVVSSVSTVFQTISNHGNIRYGNPPSGSWSFVQLTDTHWPYVGDRGDTVTNVRNALNFINEKTGQYNIEFVIITGDMIDNGMAPEAGTHYQELEAELNRLNVQWFPIQGNHDDDTQLYLSYMANYQQPAGQAGSYNRTYYSWTWSGFRFIAIGQDFGDPVNGKWQISSEELDFLRSELAMAKQNSEPAVVAFHQPLSYPPNEKYEVANPETIITTLREGDAQLFICGHVHPDDPYYESGIPEYIMPPTGQRWGNGQGGVTIFTVDQNGIHIQFFKTSISDSVQWEKQIIIDYQGNGGSWSGVWWRPFNYNSIWNTPIPADASVHPDSDRLIGEMQSRSTTPVIATYSWSIPIWHADSSTPRQNVYWWDDRVLIADVPIPNGIQTDPKRDRHVCIVDDDANIAYDFWDFYMRDGKWMAGSGAKWDLTGSGVNPNLAWNEHEWNVGARAAGVPLLAGLIKPEEIQQGKIEHALYFGMAGGAKDAWKVFPPASTTDGYSGDTWALPEGARIQLDPDIDINTLGLSETGKIIAKALQDYGAFCVDNAGGFTFYAENTNYGDRTNNPWEGVSLSIRPLSPNLFRVLDYRDNLEPFESDWWLPRAPWE